MTQNEKHGCRPLYVVALGLTVGCGSGVTAAAPCDGDVVQCAALPLSAVDEVPVEDLPRLRPTWIKSLPITDAATQQSADWRLAQLSSDREGNLWLFDRVESGVRVSRLDDEGEILNSTVLSPPKGSKTPLSSLAVNAAWETGRDPSSKLIWTRGPGCDQTVDRTPGCLSESEKVIFDRGLDREPVRVPLVESLMSDGFVNERGELFYVTSSWSEPASIIKQDRDTRSPLWTHAGTQTVNGEYDLTGAALSDGRTAVMRHGAAAYLNTIVFYWLEADGSGSSDSAEFAAQVDKTSYRLLATGNQPVVVYTDDIGDLHVDRIHKSPEETQAVTFLREDYQMLDLHASAISPSGDVYVLTQSGRRDDGQEVLCRAPADGEGSCVKLPESFSLGRDEYAKLENFVARDNGVVFAQYGTQFLRLDFPQ